MSGVNVGMLEVLDMLDIPAPGRVPGHILCELGDHAENTPSLCIYQDGWWCFGCGRGGSPIDFIMALHECSFGTALSFVRSGIDLEGRPERPEPKIKEPIDLTDTYEQEKIGWGTDLAADARAFVAGKWPWLTSDQLYDWDVVPGGRGRYLMIPHRDAAGRIVGIKTRGVSGPNKGDKKSFSGSTYPQLYRVNPRTSADDLILLEGESDLWAYSLRFPPHGFVDYASVPSGARAWASHLDEINAYNHVYVGFDNDDTGNLAAIELATKLGEGKASRSCPPPAYKDWEQAIADSFSRTMS